jgi:hypothetical protein
LFSGEFYNELLKKTDKEVLKYVKASDEKGLKTLNAKAILRNERKKFGSSVFTHV